MSEVTVVPKRRINLGFDRFSGLYVWAGLVIAFSLWIPDLFLNVSTLQNILSNEAITAMVALAFLIAVAARVFDLTVANNLTVSGCFTAWALINHHGVVIAVGGALLIGVTIGLVNAFVVVRLEVDSFIGTLGVSSILIAVAYMISDGGQIVLPDNAYGPFLDFGNNLVLGLPLPVFYLACISIVLWWVLEHTPAGRYLYAVGGNPVAAQLAGVRTGRVTTLALVGSGLLASFAGVVLVARLGLSTPDLGLPYLLPAFSAVFLGATQIRPGRVNVLGTLVAIFLLATGVKGLQLAGAPSYITDLFNGVALIVAVALAVRSAKRRG